MHHSLLRKTCCWQFYLIDFHHWKLKNFNSYNFWNHHFYSILFHSLKMDIASMKYQSSHIFQCRILKSNLRIKILFYSENHLIFHLNKLFSSIQFLYFILKLFQFSLSINFKTITFQFKNTDSFIFLFSITL